MKSQPRNEPMQLVFRQFGVSRAEELHLQCPCSIRISPGYPTAPCVKNSAPGCWYHICDAGGRLQGVVQKDEPLNFTFTHRGKNLNSHLSPGGMWKWCKAGHFRGCILRGLGSSPCHLDYFGTVDLFVGEFLIYPRVSPFRSFPTWKRKIWAQIAQADGNA